MINNYITKVLFLTFILFGPQYALMASNADLLNEEKIADSKNRFTSSPKEWFESLKNNAAEYEGCFQSLLQIRNSGISSRNEDRSCLALFQVLLNQYNDQEVEDSPQAIADAYVKKYTYKQSARIHFILGKLLETAEKSDIYDVQASDHFSYGSALDVQRLKHQLNGRKEKEIEFLKKSVVQYKIAVRFTTRTQTEKQDLGFLVGASHAISNWAFSQNNFAELPLL